MPKHIDAVHRSDDPESLTEGSDNQQNVEETPMPHPLPPPMGMHPPPPGIYPPPPMGAPLPPPPPHPFAGPPPPHRSPAYKNRGQRRKLIGSVPGININTDPPANHPKDTAKPEPTNSLQIDSETNTAKRPMRSRKGDKGSARILKSLALCLVIVTLTGLAGMSVYAWFDRIQGNNTVASTDKQNPNSIIENYIARNGGKNFLSSVNSVSYRGTIHVGQNTSKEFLHIQKRPGLSWLKTDDASGTVITATNNTDSWKKVQPTSGPAIVEKLGEAETEKLKSKFQLLNPLIDYWVDSRTDAELLGMIELESGSAFKLRVFEPETNCNHLVFLDSQTYQILRIDTVQADGYVEQTFYYNYNQVDGIWVPMKRESFADDRETERYLIDKAIINPGVMSSLFTAPQGA